MSVFDLVVELVQNDLDGGATRTEIDFSTNALICSGNGKTIDGLGWKRLAFVLGAGTEVVAKQNGIGSKNHGLRSAFLLGDQIVVQSGRERIDLTVRGHETHTDLFYPAVWPRMPDLAAPKDGVRVTVPYRTEPLPVPERNPLEPIGPAFLAHLFDDAVERAGDRFLCASAPARSWHYELSLTYGTKRATFIFDAKPAAGRRGLWLRTCRRIGSRGVGRIIERRLSAPFPIDLANNDHAKVPRLFRRGGQIFGELSWAVDRDLMPTAASGGYRYPIAYPRDHISAGCGFDISGPFISGRARHSISDDDRNALIIAAGRAAFLRVMPELLVTHGPRALVLALNAEKADQAAEEGLAADLARAGALVIAGSGPRFDLADAGRPLSFAAPTYTPAQLSPQLTALAMREGQALHPSTPQAFVDALLRLNSKGPRVVVPFSEQDAARAVFVAQDSLSSAQFDDWLQRCLVCLRALEIARLEGTLPADFLKALRASAWLPTSERKAGAWNSLYRSPKPPPVVPGVREPHLLHQALLKSPILREGNGKVRPFKLDEYLAGRDFSNVTAEGRLRFFRWLRKGHVDVPPARLAEIATYPIWPAIDGSFHPLDHYSRPRRPYQQRLVDELYAAPSDAVLNFPGLRNSSTGSLKIRRTLRPEEVVAWHSARMAQVSSMPQDQLEILRDHMVETEQTLSMLRADGVSMVTIGEAHQTLSASGGLASIQHLHIPTMSVDACALLPEDVVAGSEFALYRSLGAHDRPTASALLRALRANSSWTTLFPRLEAYRGAGRELAELNTETIVPVGDALLAPGTLSFPSTTDLWGAWKTVLESTPDVPNHVALLEACGVVRAALREDLSRDFFEWLAGQPNGIQRQHRTQIIRHWVNRQSGPAKWAERYPERRCVPVYDNDGALEMLSLAKALSPRGLIFIPDFFDSIQSDLLRDNKRMRLALTTAQGVTGSIIDALRGVGLRSLRRYAAQPARIRPSPLSSSAMLDQELALVRAPKTLDHLQKGLELHEVPSSALRNGWRRLILDLKAVRTTSAMAAVYSVLGRDYEVPAESGIDLATQCVCVRDDSDQRMAFYAALGGHVFETGSSDLYAYGLMKAVRVRHGPTHFDDLDGEWHEQEKEPITSEPEPDIGNHGPPQKGHGISPADAVPIVPDPNPLKPIVSPTYAKPGKRKKPLRRPPGRTDTARGSVEEEEHILSLKAKHYAWHCQACLGERDVLSLAPPRSYVYLPLHRRGLIEAHHVEHLQNEVLLGASNLLILCRFHHQTIGDALSRATVLDALKMAQQVIRHFPSDEDGGHLASASGFIASPAVLVEGEPLKLFFTGAHRAVWEQGRI